MKAISKHKNRYYKLDDIGFVPDKGSSRQIKLDAVRTTRHIRNLKSKSKVSKVATFLHARTISKVTSQITGKAAISK